ncbi:VOC family protein [Mesorhizobium sp. CAU 1732]|uniref:VOC family protein n=1 Tax=Mesorhizobium sp. CAU 1732 TaxID=3140358 RepID=UPI003261518A
MRFVAYLSFDGKCREAFEFYAGVLDGEIKAMISNGETPMAEHFSPESQDKIMNAYLVADGAELMGADTPDSMPYAPPEGFTLSIQLDDDARAERIFAALAEDGDVRMPMEATFWARKFGMLIDKYGIPWMVNSGMIEQST